MMGMSAKQPFGLQEAKYSGLPPSGSEAMRRMCLPAPQLQGNIFGSFDESLLARAEALAAADLVSLGKSLHPFKPDATYHTMSGGGGGQCTPAALPIPGPAPPPSHHHHHHQQQQQQHHHHNPHHHHAVAHLDGGGGGDLLDHLSPALMGGSEHGAIIAAAAAAAAAQIHPHDHPHLAAAAAMGHLHQAMASMGHPPPPPPPPPPASTPAALSCLGEPESSSDPRELEAFAERFKQRRIKLGVTQADVGSALGSLKIPGVGSLSQSTICRFESLTLSHNNMVALKPVLRAWLDGAEAERKGAKQGDGPGLGPGAGVERKRKRTSIAAPEKRSLEAYFALQPRPSSEKIAAIAEKLELRKNVVRVWFCNQRQKQKRMKYSAVH